jgi:hypothetical protein
MLVVREPNSSFTVQWEALDSLRAWNGAIVCDWEFIIKSREIDQGLTRANEVQRRRVGIPSCYKTVSRQRPSPRVGRVRATQRYGKRALG